MKSIEEFEQFLTTDTEMASDLTKIDTQRKSIKKSFFIILIIAIVFVIVMGYVMYNKTKETGSGAETNNMIYLVLLFIGGAFAITYLYSFFFKKNTSSAKSVMSGGSGDINFDFKDRVIRKMVAFWDPTFKYQINNHIKASEVLESGMIYPTNYKMNGSDMIQGMIDGIDFRFSDIQLLHEKTFVKKNEEPYTTIVFGSFFIANFPKELKNKVFVHSKSSFEALRYEGEKVQLEDPEFMKRFHVYAPDQIEARYILTTSMMERIKALADKMGNRLYIAFANSKVYILNNNNKDRFETSWFTQVNKRETLLQFYNELAEQLSIIEELKLNNNIWNL
jgi:hypothetical protein